MRDYKVFISTILVAAVMLAMGSVGFAEVTPEAPVVVTTCGQSPGALMVKLICKKAGLECDQKDDLVATDLEGGKYKTVIITTGTSLKGMGAAGTDIDAEVARIEGVLEEARNQGMTVIGAHVEGMARRVDATDELSIETVIPVSDIIIVKEDSDSDGFFTKLSEEKGIPLYKAKETLDLTEVFKELFKVE